MKLHARIATMALVAATAFAAVFASCGGREPARQTGGAVFDISGQLLEARTDTLVDIGRLRSGEVIRYDARLRNVGTEPLVVRNITTSCGCTSVEYTREPIAPGASGEFSFSFDSRGMWGTQLKLIEIATSASPLPYKVMVRAEVEE
ncbi:MAG: DUF1573 domain-containing protein [Alistipes sp.]|jgi:hypothetical protein|nr:DUF1573 domain-containing protein [Alistipes sp.]